MEIEREKKARETSKLGGFLEEPETEEKWKIQRRH